MEGSKIKEIVNITFGTTMETSGAKDWVKQKKLKISKIVIHPDYSDGAFSTRDQWVGSNSYDLALVEINKVSGSLDIAFLLVCGNQILK